MELEGRGPARAVQVTSFICINCTQTCHLSTQGLFLSHAAFHLHISYVKACRNAGMGYRELPIQVWAVDVIAEAGAKRDLRLQSVIKSQVNWQAQ